VTVVEGRVAAYHPEAPHKKVDVETITVGGQTWRYYSANLGSGGYRGVPPAIEMVRVGSLVRISSYEGRILKLEVLER
jgi:hypothetical protein